MRSSFFARPRAAVGSAARQKADTCANAQGGRAAMMFTEIYAKQKADRKSVCSVKVLEDF